MRFVMMTLCLSFWMGVAGQELPFAIEVEDLNLGSGINQPDFYVNGNNLYLLPADNCLYHSDLDGNLTHLDCDDTRFRYHLPMAEGVFRLSYDVAKDEYYIGFITGANYTELFRSASPIRAPALSPSGRLTYLMENKVWSISHRGDIVELIQMADLATSGSYYVPTPAGSVLLIKVNDRMYTTDGTPQNTRIVVEEGINSEDLAWSETHIYFSSGRGTVWQYEIGSAAAQKVLEQDHVGVVGWVKATATAGIVTIHPDGNRSEGQVYAVLPGGDYRRIRVGENGPEVTSRTVRSPVTVEGHSFFIGDTATPGLYVTDGTDAGTHRLLEHDFTYTAGYDISNVSPIRENQVVFAAGRINSEEYDLYLYDLTTTQLRIVGAVADVRQIKQLASTETLFIFKTARENYILDKTSFKIRVLGENIDDPYDGTAVTSKSTYHKRLRNRLAGTRDGFDGIYSVSHSDGTISEYELRSSGGEVLSVTDIKTLGDVAYATAQASTGEIFVFRLGQTVDEVVQVTALDMLQHSAISGLYSAQKELVITNGRDIYTYQNGVLGSIENNANATPLDYLGMVDGHHAFTYSTAFLIPTLGIATTFFLSFSQSARSRHSPYRIVNERAYILKYTATSDPNAGLWLYAADASVGRFPDVVLTHPFEARETAFDLHLSAVDDVLYYALPGAAADDMRASWYFYDSRTSSSGKVAALTDVEYLGGRPAVVADNLYFTGRYENASALLSYTPGSEKVKAHVALYDGEYLVDVFEGTSGLTALTDRRIVSLIDGSTYTTVPDDGQTFTRIDAVGDNWLLELSDENSLSYYVFQVQQNRLLPIATGYDKPGYYASNTPPVATIGSNALFWGTKDDRYLLHLYNSDRHALYDLGAVSRSMINSFSRAIATAHQGEFYYTMLDPEAGLELHHFRPPYAHTLSGQVTNDRNGLPLPGRRVTATGSGNGLSAYTDSLGNYTLYLSAETDYIVTVLATNCNEASVAYSLTTGNAKKQQALARDFALTGLGNTATLTPHLASGPARCGFTVPFWLTVTNDGCQTTPDGTVTLQLHKEAELIAADTEPTTTTDEGRLSWTLPPLAPGTDYQVKLQLKMPDEDLAGQEIPMPVYTSFTTADGAEVADTFTYDDILRCAIDPNDKRAFPRRAEPTNSGYVQYDETITYMIRFQNTGNDTAFTVRLEDQLSDSLDYTTFQPLTSSHDYEVTLTEEGLLEVLYRNILLVDSTTNEPGSHGFFTFSIQAKEGLEDFDEITNQAGIFFDFNRPVITNRAKNTFVEALDADGDGYMFFVDCDDTNAAVNPGMADIPNNGIDENCDGADLTTGVSDFGSRVLRLAPNPTRSSVSIELAEGGAYGYTVYDARGQRVGQGRFRGQEATVPLGHLARGVYLLRLTDVAGGSLTRRVVRY